MSKIQNSDVKGTGDVTANSRLINTDKLYVTKTGEVLDSHLRKNDDAKTAAPGASDDNTAGWEVGSRWTDTTNDKVYFALDVSTAAAVWQEVGAGGGGSVSATDESATVSGTMTTLKVKDGTLVDQGSGVFLHDPSAVIQANVFHENVYSAKIDADAGGGSVISQSSQFIASLVRNSVGNYTINFDSGFFTAAPSVTVACSNGGDRTANIVTPPSTTSVRVQMNKASDGAAVEDDFWIMLQRQGADYEAPDSSVVTQSDNVAPSRVIDNDTNNTIPNATKTHLGWDTIDKDDDSNFVGVGNGSSATYTSATYWTCPKTGWYQVDAQWYTADANLDLDENFTTSIEVNGSSKVERITKVEYSAASPRINSYIGSLLYLTAGQNVSIAVTQDSGATITLNPSPFDSHFSVYRIDKSPLIAIGNETCYLKDIKSNSVSGGSSSAATYQTRTLNTLEGSTTFCSLSANQFTIQPGKYSIQATAPAHATDRNRIRLRNITDSTTDILGSSEQTFNGSEVSVRSTIHGELNITSAKTYEIQHYTQSAKATSGLGLAVSSGEQEVYTIVKIVKLK